MRRTQAWARRATAVLLSLAMAGSGLPPAALAQAMDDIGEDPVQLVDQLDETSKDEGLLVDQRPVQNGNQVVEGLPEEESPLEEVDLVEEENQAEDAQEQLGEDSGEPADEIQLVEDGDDDADVDVIVQGDPAAYAVTIAEGIQNGTLTADVAEAAEGATVTLTATPDAGYALASLAVTQTEGGEPVTATPGEAPGTYTVSMPAVAITATATFAKAVATVTAADGATTAYATPAAALEAWTDGCTLALQADWVYTDGNTDYIHVDDHGDRTLDLNGHGVDARNAWNYSIYGGGSGTGSLTVVDSNPDVEHRYTVSSGGLATVDDGMAEGYQTFRGGYVTGYHGAIYLNDSSLSMTGGTLIGNTYGAVFARAGTLELDGTAITGNISGGYASALYAQDTKVTLRDVTVTGNVDDQDTYGAVYVYGSKPFRVQGSTTISGNFGRNGTTPMNLFLDGTKLTVTGPLTGTFGVRVGKPGTFTSGLPGNGGLDNFTSEMNEDLYEITLTDEGEAQIAFHEGVCVIPSSGSDTYDMTGASVGDSVTVYDERGPNANYGNSWDGTLTIVPPAGKAIQVTGSVDTENSWDYLYVYEASTEGDLLAKVSGTGRTVDVTVTDDPLVLRLSSDGSYNDAGVALTVTVVDVPADYAAQTKYDVTCSPAEHGSVSVDKTSTWEGKLVTITATPDEGYLLSGITVNGGSIQTNPDRSTYTFVMPAENTTVAATFEKGVTVTFLDADGTELSSIGPILPGTVVTAPEVDERAGAILAGWARDGEQFDLSAPVTEDTTLTAMWVEGQAQRFYNFIAGIPEGWTQQGESYDTLWYTSNDRSDIHGTCLFHKWTPDPEPHLIMSATDLSSVQGATLSFLYKNLPWGDVIDQLGIDYRVGEDGEWKTIFQTTEAHESWTSQTLNLIDLIPEEDRTDELYIAFRADTIDGEGVWVTDVNLFRGCHDWRYAADDEADAITATCANGADVCNMAGVTPTITLSTKDTVFSGDPVEATVTLDDEWTKANGLAAYAITYSQGGTQLRSAPTKVGTYTATLTLGKGEGALSVSKDFSITERMYVDATGTTCTYDGKAHGINVNVSVDGATVTYSESRDGKYSTKAPTFTDAGTHTVWYRVSKDGHKTKSGSADVVIKPKAVGISWSGTKLTYNAKNQGPTAKATGLVSGDKCTVTVSGAAKDAGTHTATATALSNANYKLPGKSTTKFAIAKAKLTVTAKDKTIKFGAKPANAGVTYSGLKGKDTAKSLGGKLTYKYTYKKGSKAGTYKIAPSGLKSKNYAITYNKGTLTVEAPSTVATRGAVRADGKDWVDTDKNGVFGTTGESRRTTGIKIGLEQLPYSGGILYKGHFQDKGWQSSWTLGDSKCAVKNKRLEAVQIKLKGEMADHYNVYYRVHTQKLGWMAWAKDGERAGTTSTSDRLEAVQVVVQKKGTKAPGKNYNKVKQTYPKAYTEKV